MRPIDADELMRKYCGACDLDEMFCLNCKYHEFRVGIKNAPTIEPEQRHGRMIEGKYPNENKCSEFGQTFRDDIGFIIQDNHGEFHYPKRCPECGCYWDGGDEDAAD